MLDEVDFRPDERLPEGPMRVTEADASFKSQKDRPLASDEAKKKGTNANRDRQNVIKKNQEMNRYSIVLCFRQASCRSLLTFGAVDWLTGMTMIRLRSQKLRADGTRLSY